MSENLKFKFIDLFAGLCGIRLGFELAELIDFANTKLKE
jgi:site-specific DNA-cytosine methylase